METPRMGSSDDASSHNYYYVIERLLGQLFVQDFKFVSSFNLKILSKHV